MIDLENTDPNFVQELIESDRYVDIAINYFIAQGFSVSKPTTRIRPNIQVKNEYSDRGDFLVVDAMKEFGEGWVDVKGRKFHFTNKNDYPHGSVFVCNPYRFKNSPCWKYVIINEAGTHGILIPGTTFRTWEPIIRYSEKRGREKEIYTAPMSVCTFIEF